MRGMLNELALFASNGNCIIAKYNKQSIRCCCAVEENPASIALLCKLQNTGTINPFPIWEGSLTTFDERYFYNGIDIVSGKLHSYNDKPKKSRQDFAYADWQKMYSISKEVNAPYIVVGAEHTDTIEIILDFIENKYLSRNSDSNYYEVENLMIDYSNEQSQLGHWVVLSNQYIIEQKDIYSKTDSDSVNLGTLRMLANIQGELDGDNDIMGTFKISGA